MQRIARRLDVQAAQIGGRARTRLDVQRFFLEARHLTTIAGLLRHEDGELFFLLIALGVFQLANQLRDDALEGALELPDAALVALEAELDLALAAAVQHDFAKRL